MGWAPGKSGAQHLWAFTSLEGVVCGAVTEHAGWNVIWSIAARPSSYQQYGKDSVLYQAKRKIEYAKAQLRAKVEPRFR